MPLVTGKLRATCSRNVPYRETVTLMASAEVLVRRLSDWYDQFKPDVKSIRVKLSRATCMKWARPETRGGPLFYRGREIIHNPKKKPGE